MLMPTQTPMQMASGYIRKVLTSLEALLLKSVVLALEVALMVQTLIQMPQSQLFTELHRSQA